jgi:NAD(P)-dependent dehydrogenase (short-subunit alcohol dehydrogenase family)
VDTPIWDAVADGNKGAVQAAMATRLPVRRLGTPEDLAQAYLFLMQNGFATGTIVHVDGGHRLV